MQIKHDVKGQLAKLLATEDLIVEHRSVETASFNVASRVLTLPTWDKAGEEVYDLLVCHEVGHALYTPDQEWWIDNEISHSIVNIVEDARIEKLMKRRYAGLSKTFFRGYSDLSEDDFFQLDGKDLSKFNLADRINLYYKVGNFVDIPFFSNEETFLMNRTGLTETFEEVLEVAKLIFEYCKAEAEKKKEEDMKADAESSDTPNDNTTQGQSGDDAPVDNVDDKGEEGEEEMQVVDKESGKNDIQGGYEGGDLEATTDEIFTDSLKELSNPTSGESFYIEMPKLDLNKFIVNNQELHKNMMLEWDEDQVNVREDYIARNPNYKNESKEPNEVFTGFVQSRYNPLDLYGRVDSDFAQFKKRCTERS